METYLDYARRGRNDWWRYVLGFVGAIGIFFVGALIVCLGLMLCGLISLADMQALQQQMASMKNPAAFFAANGVVFGLLAASFMAAAALFNRKAPLDLLGRWRWKDYALGAVIWAVAVMVLALVDLAIAPGSFRYKGSATTFGFAGWAFAGLLVQTFTEEYVFRGYLTQGWLLVFKSPVPAAVASGLVFGLMHIPNGWPQALNATVLGVCLALIAIRTGGIAFGCGLHLVNNLFGAVVLVSTSDVFDGSPAIFEQNTPHLMWFDVALSSLAIAGLAAWMVWRPRRDPLAAA